jgi:hypothetical protein
VSHDYHPDCPGYNADQILIDGCSECESRAEDVERTLANLDHRRFQQAWLRAADRYASTPPSGERPSKCSEAEMPLLRTLWAIQVQLERLGMPLGYLPAGNVLMLDTPLSAAGHPIPTALVERVSIR